MFNVNYSVANLNFAAYSKVSVSKTSLCQCLRIANISNFYAMGPLLSKVAGYILNSMLNFYLVGPLFSLIYDGSKTEIQHLV